MKDKLNFQLYQIENWEKNNYNIYVTQYLKK